MGASKKTISLTLTGLAAVLAGGVWTWSLLTATTTPEAGRAAMPAPAIPVPSPVNIQSASPQAAAPKLDSSANPIDGATTAAVIRPEIPVDPTATPQSLAVLKSGLDALGAGDVQGAIRARDSLPVAATDQQALSWAIALDGGPAISQSELEKSAIELSGWPGLDRLRSNLERAALRESETPESVIQTLGGSDPSTASGALALAGAYMAIGQTENARRALISIWHRSKLRAADEVDILARYGGVLTQADHRIRMEAMFYADRVESAQRVAGIAGADQLAAAWTAVILKTRDAAKLLDAVPKEQRSAGYVFAKAEYLRGRNRISEAAALLKDVGQDKDTLIDPDAWWIERRLLARELLDAGKPSLAYAVAAGHAAESPVNFVEAEFHVGWIALRYLKRPADAAVHFKRIADRSDGPLSRSRAFYWMGRAADAGGPGNAKEFYGKAAHYGTTFYGQLAAEKLGSSTISVATPAPSRADRISFASRNPVRAISRLSEAGYPERADALCLALAQQLTSVGELALLADTAAQRGNHYLALKIGKIAAQRGLDAGGLSHPVGVIPPDADISGAGKALAYAIARQESEFNVAAVSRVGALGLLQLMPGTAKEVARNTGLAYAPERLTTDAAYNAALGAAFLGEQLDRFDGSYILTFAGYNAGPRRAQQWIARYGDPRGKTLDSVVDWIERIPFAETRAYVQRVMENYQVYKMQLTGETDIATDLRFGRRL